ncbi:hypothetical protein [Clostridium saudiense]|nr:hypothetical protein [Clostridium saudiense]
MDKKKPPIEAVDIISRAWKIERDKVVRLLLDVIIENIKAGTVDN